MRIVVKPLASLSTLTTSNRVSGGKRTSLSLPCSAICEMSLPRRDWMTYWTLPLYSQCVAAVVLRNGSALQEVFLMGEKARPKPAWLAEKLKEIRIRIDGGLTQVEMIKRLGFTEEELPQEGVLSQLCFEFFLQLYPPLS